MTLLLFTHKKSCCSSTLISTLIEKTMLDPWTAWLCIQRYATPLPCPLNHGHWTICGLLMEWRRRWRCGLQSHAFAAWPGALSDMGKSLLIRRGLLKATNSSPKTYHWTGCNSLHAWNYCLSAGEWSSCAPGKVWHKFNDKHNYHRSKSVVRKRGIVKRSPFRCSSIRQTCSSLWRRLKMRKLYGCLFLFFFS